jgi:predicted Zn-dependent protease
MRVLIVLATASLVLTGCQNMPNYSWPNGQPAQPITKPAAPAAEQRVIQSALPSANYDGLKPSEIPPLLKSMPPVVVQPQRQLADGRNMPAVQSLLASATISLQQGKPEDAANSLERAQRLAPQSAAVYQKLAEVRLQQGRTIEAEQLARKGLSYAQGNAQQAALWRLIAAAADKQGKKDTADHARDRVMQLESAGDRG